MYLRELNQCTRIYFHTRIKKKINNNTTGHFHKTDELLLDIKKKKIIFQFASFSIITLLKHNIIINYNNILMFLIRILLNIYAHCMNIKQTPDTYIYIIFFLTGRGHMLLPSSHNIVPQWTAV